MTTHAPEKPRHKVLVVEDSRTQAERLRHILEHAGYEVAVAVNGRFALDAVPVFRPDVVISDVNMPQMDGYELSRRLKADPASRSIPVILVSTMSDPQDVIRGLECGADNFVLKPYEELYMLGQVAFVLANRDMREADDPSKGVGIFFNGQRHVITADRVQILNLLLSTYDAAIQRNRQISQSKETLEQRSAEIGLANHFLDQVIENIPHMIFVKDPVDLRFVRVNRALEELVGHSKEELIGKNDHDFFPAAEAEAFIAKDRKVLASGGVEALDEPIHTRYKGVRTLRTRKLVINDELGQPQFLLGISEDVTEKKEQEREILRLNAELHQRTVDADAASSAKSTFVATMSHEIRTPMNGMLGMLEMLDLTPLDADQRATLAVIRESSTSLLRIVDDVLDFSKIEAGQLEIHPEATSVPQVLSDVQRAYSGAAGAKGIELKWAADPGLSPRVLVDALRLRQVLGNFVSNAIKFTPAGSVEIAAHLVERATDGKERIEFKVRDTGVGISAANQSRLFQPFSQGDSEAARLAGGTGLGLTICRRIAELMNGTISMESVLGRGTTLTLTLMLPTAALDEQDATAGNSPAPFSAAEVHPEAPTVAQAEAEDRLILLVDDHPTNRMLLLRQLNKLGYAAEAAKDGFEALALWKSRRFAAVLTDCDMPGMSGYELTDAIRSIENQAASPRTPMIACTAHALTGEAEKCLAAGMDDYIVKPIDLRGLQKVLRQWVPLTAATAGARWVERPAKLHAHEAEPLNLTLIVETWGDDPKTLEGVLDLFKRGNDEDVSSFRQAIASRDLRAAATAAHRMVGGGKVVGADAFAAVCEDIHTACTSADWTLLEASLPAFEQQWKRLNAWIGLFPRGVVGA